MTFKENKLVEHQVFLEKLDIMEALPKLNKI
jgi:hypothetical protein